MNKIEIPLDNGYKLIAERNINSEFDKELFIGIETPQGLYIQDLAIIRPTYKFDGNDIKFDSDRFEMLIFGEANNEDYTNKFTVPLNNEDDE